MTAWIEDAPPAIARLKTAKGVEAMWREIAAKIYSPRVLDGTPPYLERIAFAFWDVDPMRVPRSIRDGDVALFVAMLIRLDQIDAAMVAIGRTEAERSPVLYARHVVDGLREAAQQQLLRKGGTWPPGVSAVASKRRKSSRSGTRSGRRGQASAVARPTPPER